LLTCSTRLASRWFSITQPFALYTSEPVPKGADPHPAPFFYWLPCAVTPESGGRVVLMVFPSKAIAFEQPARPHAPASRLKGAAPAQPGALFFSRPKFGQAASSRKNNEGDNHGRAQRPQLKFGEHLAVPTPQIGSI